MGRSPCCDKNGLKKGPWTPEEDTKLIQYIQMHGPANWRNLPKNAGLQRCGKSCRLRWTNYLRPDIKRGRFSFEEEETIIQLHSVLGNKWSAIAARLPGRTDNEIKNYWNTHIRKRLLRNGIDPVTHAPRLDLLHLSSSLLSTQQQQLDLSNLLRLQTLLINPEALRLALSTLLTSSNDYQNPNILLQKMIQENQFSNCPVQDQQAPVFQPNQFENIINKQIPLNNIPTACMFQNDQAHIMQGSSSIAAHDQYKTHLSLPEQNMQNSFYGTTFDQNHNEGYISDNTSFDQSTLNSNSSSQNFSFDSVLSTPSVSVNNIDGATTQDADDLFKFEIPGSFDLDELL